MGARHLVALLIAAGGFVTAGDEAASSVGVAGRARVQAGKSDRAATREAARRHAILVAEDARATSASELAPLIEGVHSRTPELQRLAVRALGRLERPSLAPHITPLLSAASPDVRAEAANALGQAAATDPGIALAPLLRRLELEQEPAVRGVIFETLGRLPYTDAEGVRRVEQVLVSGTWEDRAASDSSVRFRTGPPRLIVQSELVARDAPVPAALGAVKGLESLLRLHARKVATSPRTIDRLRYMTRSLAGARVRRLALAALVAAGDADRQTMADVASDSDAQVRRLAVMPAATDPASGRGTILDRLRDGSPMVRYEALRVYGRELPCVLAIAAIDDASPHVSLLAIDLLGSGCPAGEDPGRRLLQIAGEVERPGPSAEQQSAAASHQSQARSSELRAPSPQSLAPGPQPPTWHRPAHALVALTKVAPDRAAGLLPRFVEHPTWQVRMYAARAAALLNDGAVLERLAADDTDNVREAALEGLVRVKGHEADAAYLAALARSDYQLVRAAARALEGSPNVRAAVPALLAALARLSRERRDTSRDPRLAILARLREFGAPADAPALLPYLRDFDPSVAAGCAQVLEGWTGQPHRAATTRLATVRVPSAADLARLRGATAHVTMAGHGTFELRLLAEEAPVTVARFVALARRGYYDGLTFHRVAPNFVIQGGSPGANEYMGDGPYLRDELGLRPHVRGAVGISTRGRDTGDAQIFIDLVDNPRLDHHYTVFAEVVSGMEVVDAVLEGDVIERVEIVGGATAGR